MPRPHSMCPLVCPSCSLPVVPMFVRWGEIHVADNLAKYVPVRLYISKCSHISFRYEHELTLNRNVNGTPNTQGT